MYGKCTSFIHLFPVSTFLDILCQLAAGNNALSAIMLLISAGEIIIDWKPARGLNVGIYVKMLTQKYNT